MAKNWKDLGWFIRKKNDAVYCYCVTVVGRSVLNYPIRELCPNLAIMIEEICQVI